MCYFEFLPVHINNGVSSDSVSVPDSLNEKEQQKLVDLVDVKLGQEYELVVTTYAGLYRYRVGDVLRVAGFKNKAPQFNFICRKNVVLTHLGLQPKTPARLCFNETNLGGDAAGVVVRGES